jgi:hypothetical protein
MDVCSDTVLVTSMRTAFPYDIPHQHNKQDFPVSSEDANFQISELSNVAGCRERNASEMPT